MYVHTGVRVWRGDIVAAYSAPTRLGGDGPACGRRATVWSRGAVWYELGVSLGRLEGVLIFPCRGV